MFGWNEKKIKSRVWNPQIGNHEIVMASAKEIVNQPNYHQPEAIISAIAKAVGELIAFEEDRTARMQNLMNSASSITAPIKNPDQTELIPEETEKL